jgi:hypothetical protein
VSEPDYFVLLKEAKRQTPVSRRLIAAVEQDGKRGSLLFTGFLTDGLALRGIALVHAPKAMPANGPGRRNLASWPLGLVAAIIATPPCCASSPSRRASCLRPHKVFSLGHFSDWEARP